MGTIPGLGDFQAWREDLPEFEQPQAAKMPLRRGEVSDAIAHVNARGRFSWLNPDTWNRIPDRNIYVDHPEKFSQPVYAHEVMHGIQDANGGVANSNRRGAEGYNYGGVAGLRRLAGSGKTIAALNSEQQADIPLNYMKALAAYRAKARTGQLTSSDLKDADELNAGYSRAIRQEANMAAPKGNLDQPPPAPGPPPAALTGTIVPLREVGGPAVTNATLLVRPGRGQKISRQTARAYYERAGGDPEKARTMAEEHGWKVGR